jgi:hypothetical protein
MLQHIYGDYSESINIRNLYNLYVQLVKAGKDEQAIYYIERAALLA